MSEIGDVLTELGVTELPPVFAEVMPDLMDIISESNSTDSGGGRVKTATASAYANVPVSYEAMNNEARAVEGGKQLSVTEYLLTFPSYTTAGARINTLPSHRLKVLARSAEPIKWFRIISLRDISGVYWEAVCEKED